MCTEHTDYSGRGAVGGSWSLALPPLPSTVGISFSESFFLAATTARGVLLGYWEPLGASKQQLREKAFRNAVSSLGEIHQWKPLSWSGRKPVVRTQRWSVNPQQCCQTEHCFPFHIPRLMGGFPSPSLHQRYHYYSSSCFWGHLEDVLAHPACHCSCPTVTMQNPCGIMDPLMGNGGLIWFWGCFTQAPNQIWSECDVL